MDKHVLTGMKASRKRELERLTGKGYEIEFAIPQLNRVEQEEMQRFLKWLMANTTSYDFYTFSLSVVLLTDTLREAGIYIKASTDRTCPTELVIYWTPSEEMKLSTQIWFHGQGSMDKAWRASRTQAQQVSYPRELPDSMIETLRLSTSVRNDMRKFWKLGTDAAELIRLQPYAESPWSPVSDIYYEVESDDLPATRFDGFVQLQAGHTFPTVTQSLLEATEELLKGLSDNQIKWIHQHTALDYLRRQTTIPSDESSNLELFSKY